jgi:TetR/AcrR family transcriptional regulator, transcriptional repressor for nem operon
LARPRAFDDEQALDAAISCFWRHGLAATSIRDLAAAMNMNVPSLYNAFGDKNALFKLAIEKYAVRSMRERIARLESQCAPKEAIETFFRELIQRSTSDPEHRGCFIVNSALEVAAHDEEIRTIVASYTREIEAFFLRCIKRGQAQGAIDAALKPAEMASHFLGLVFGIRVAARCRPERKLLDGMVQPALKLLES